MHRRLSNSCWAQHALDDELRGNPLLDAQRALASTRLAGLRRGPSRLERAQAEVWARSTVAMVASKASNVMFAGCGEVAWDLAIRL